MTLMTSATNLNIWMSIDKRNYVFFVCDIYCIRFIYCLNQLKNT